MPTTHNSPWHTVGSPQAAAGVSQKHCTQEKEPGGPQPLSFVCGLSLSEGEYQSSMVTWYLLSPGLKMTGLQRFQSWHDTRKDQVQNVDTVGTHHQRAAQVPRDSFHG